MHQAGLNIATKSVANATKFLPMRLYLNTHSPFATENICQLVAKQQYCDYHKSWKTTHKSVIGYLNKLENYEKQQKTCNICSERTHFPTHISLVGLQGLT